MKLAKMPCSDSEHSEKKQEDENVEKLSHFCLFSLHIMEEKYKCFEKILFSRKWNLKN